MQWKYVPNTNKSNEHIIETVPQQKGSGEQQNKAKMQG